MPGPDRIPGVSQVKSGVQLAYGDVKGAVRLQNNLMQQCPGVSQVTSVAHLVVGDPKGALETQKRFLSSVNNTTNSIPGLGHAKGAVHHIVGDREGGNRVYIDATRTTVAMVAGGATAGLGTIPATIEYDRVVSQLSGKPQGYVAAVNKLRRNYAEVDLPSHILIQALQ